MIVHWNARFPTFIDGVLIQPLVSEVPDRLATHPQFMALVSKGMMAVKVAPANLAKRKGSVVPPEAVTPLPERDFEELRELVGKTWDPKALEELAKLYPALAGLCAEQRARMERRETPDLKHIKKGTKKGMAKEVSPELEGEDSEQKKIMDSGSSPE